MTMPAIIALPLLLTGPHCMCNAKPRHLVGLIGRDVADVVKPHFAGSHDGTCIKRAPSPSSAPYSPRCSRFLLISECMHTTATIWVIAVMFVRLCCDKYSRIWIVDGIQAVPRPASSLPPRLGWAMGPETNNSITNRDTDGVYSPCKMWFPSSGLSASRLFGCLDQKKPGV